MANNGDLMLEIVSLPAFKFVVTLLLGIVIIVLIQMMLRRREVRPLSIPPAPNKII